MQRYQDAKERLRYASSEAECEAILDEMNAISEKYYAIMRGEA